MRLSEIVVVAKLVASLTARVPDTVTLVAKVAVVLPLFKKFGASTHADPLQRRVVLVVVPLLSAGLSTHWVEVPVVDKSCPAVPTAPVASSNPFDSVVVAKADAPLTVKLLAIVVVASVLTPATSKSFWMVVVAKVDVPLTTKSF